MAMPPRMLKRVMLCAVALGMTGAAACADSAAPKDETPACERNNTATVQFENRSATGKVYDVIWDGSNRTTLTAGAKSSVYTEAAGIQHTLLFKISNSSTPACSQSTPVLTECSGILYYCDT